MNLKERHSKEKPNFERTTDEFRKNVIRTNDLPRLFTLVNIIILSTFEAIGRYGHYQIINYLYMDRVQFERLLLKPSYSD